MQVRWLKAYDPDPNGGYRTGDCVIISSETDEEDEFLRGLNTGTKPLLNGYWISNAHDDSKRTGVTLEIFAPRARPVTSAIPALTNETK